jgi:hypothetical protein
METYRPVPTPEELEALKAELESRFPEWRFVGVGHGYGDWYLTASASGRFRTAGQEFEPEDASQRGRTARRAALTIATRVRSNRAADRLDAVGLHAGAVMRESPDFSRRRSPNRAVARCP